MIRRWVVWTSKEIKERVRAFVFLMKWKWSRQRMNQAVMNEWERRKKCKVIISRAFDLNWIGDDFFLLSQCSLSAGPLTNYSLLPLPPSLYYGCSFASPRWWEESILAGWVITAAQVRSSFLSFYFSAQRCSFIGIRRARGKNQEGGQVLRVRERERERERERARMVEWGIPLCGGGKEKRLFVHPMGVAIAVSGNPGLTTS